MKKIILAVLFSSIFILGGCFGSTDDSFSGKSNEEVEIQKSKFKEIINLMAMHDSKRSDTGKVQNGIYIYDLNTTNLEYYTVSYLLELSEDQTVDILSKMYNGYEANEVSAFVLSGKALEYSGLGNYTGAESFNIPVLDLIQLTDVVSNVETGLKHYADGGEVNLTDPEILLSETVVEEYQTFEVVLSAKNIQNESMEAVDLEISYDPNYIELTSTPVTLSGDMLSGLEMITNPEAGKIGISVTNTSGMTLDGELMRLNFKAVQDGNTSISINKADFINTSLDKIIMDYSDKGTVSIDPGVAPSSNISLSNASGTVGTKGVIDVGLNEVSESISGIELDLAYDSSVLSAEDILVNFTGNLSEAQKIVNVENGTIKIAGSFSDSAILDGKIMDISLGLLAEGTTNITIESAKIIKGDLTEITGIDISDTSTITISKAEDLTLQSISVSPTSAQVNLDASYALPDTGTATMSDLSTKTVNLNWSPSTVDTSTVGTSDYTASYSENGVTKTAILTVTVKEGTTPFPEPASYFSTNPNNSLGKYSTGINVTGSFDGWTEDMLIAQGAANTVAQSFKGSHEAPVYDTYALYAAWDDENLYLGWQFVNVVDVTDPAQNYPISDNGKPWNGDIPQMLAFDIDPNLSGTGTLEDGETGVWSATGTLFNTFDNGMDKLAMFSSKPGVGEPAIFSLTPEGTFSYEAEYVSNFTDHGVSFNYVDGLMPSITEIYGVNKPGAWAGYSPDDLLVDSEFSEFIGLGHSTSQDTFYEMKIPLSTLGITRDYIETQGIGVMHISTFGQSGIASLPYDPTVFDNVTEEYSADPSSSAEKEDVDVFTAPMARIGG